MSGISIISPSLKTKAIMALSGIAVLAVTHGVVGYWFYNRGYESHENQVLKESIAELTRHAKDLADQQTHFNEGVLALNNSLQIHAQTVNNINRKLEKELANPIYRSTRVPASGMRFIAESARELNSKRVP